MGKTAHELFVGQKASFTKTLTEADVILFSGITGDLNPVHINQVYAEQTMFKNRIVHGGLVSALFSTVLGMYLPGNGTIFLEQDSKFVKPVYFNDTITATVTVEEIILEKNRVRLTTEAINQKGETVVKGYAIVLAPR
ncbi:MAG TPA: MaoC family dehydratase [Acholeplasmataceae bacterium]|nr:MaoC family dehydratase [Acholeplasmataceae bacterium]